MAQELESLYQWYGEQLDLTNDQSNMLRYQASRRVLKYLFSGAMESMVASRYQYRSTSGPEQYMARDAFDTEETQ